LKLTRLVSHEAIFPSLRLRQVTVFRRVFICIFSISGLLPLQAEDWFRWRGPDSDGVSKETDWNGDWSADGPKITWTKEVGIGFSSIVVKNERAYTLGHVDGHDVVYCLDVTDGREVWKHAYVAPLDDRDFEGGPTSTPTVDGDRLYVLSRAGELFCFNAATGEMVWKKHVADEVEVRLPGWGFSGSPLVVDEKVLINMGESGVALNKHDGKLIWSSQDRECGYATPVIYSAAEGAIAVFASSRAFIGVDLETGEQRWSERWLTSFNCNAADPIIHDTQMFVSSGYNRGSALYELAGGKPESIWKSKDLQNQLHSSILYEKHLYGIDGDMDAGAKLKCMDWSSGEIVWSVEDLNPGGLALAGGKLIVLTESGELFISEASPDPWKPLARAQVLEGKCRTVPVMSGGRIYCRTVGGQVACVDCRD